jgi:hypothetical protein
MDEAGVLKLCKRVLRGRLGQSGVEGEATDGDPHGHVASLEHVAVALGAVDEGAVVGPAGASTDSLCRTGTRLVLQVGECYQDLGRDHRGVSRCVGGGAAGDLPYLVV